jgi:hypothetical protein
MSRTRPLAAVIALATALAIAPALTGCSALEGIINEATGGEVNVSIGRLPDGWPAEVPVIEGDILGGGAANSDDGTPGWNVTITVDDESAFDAIASQLTDAGFEPVDAGQLDGGDNLTSGMFKNDSYGVIVAVTGAEGNYVANYTVVEGDPAE